MRYKYNTIESDRGQYKETQGTWREKLVKKMVYFDAQGELLSYQQAAERSNLGICTTMKLAKESGALIKIGRIARVNWPVFYNFIVENYQA